MRHLVPAGHYTFYYAAMGIYLPFLPLFLANAGLNSMQIGLLLAINPLIGIFAQVAWGSFADRHNRRKEYLLLALAMATVMAFTFSLPKGMAGLAFVLFVYSLFNSGVAPLSDALILGALPDRRDYGMIRRWGSLGFAVTAALGGVIFTYMPLSNFGLVEGVFLVGTLLWARVLPNPRWVGSQVAPSNSPFMEVIKTPGVLSFLGVTMLIMVPYNAYTSFFGWHMQSLGASNWWIGLGWFLAASSEFLVFGTGGAWLKAFQPKHLIAFGALVFAARWLGYAYIDDYRMIALLQISQSISFALFFLAGVEYLSSMLPAYLRGSAQSVFSATGFGVSALIGTLGAGWVIKEANSQILYLILALLVFLGALGGVRYLKKVPVRQ